MVLILKALKEGRARAGLFLWHLDSPGASNRKVSVRARSSRANASPASVLSSKVWIMICPLVPIRPQLRISETPPNKVG